VQGLATPRTDRRDPDLEIRAGPLPVHRRASVAQPLAHEVGLGLRGLRQEDVEAIGAGARDPIRFARKVADDPADPGREAVLGAGDGRPHPDDQDGCRVTVAREPRILDA
jgi:hypothetical protein